MTSRVAVKTGFDSFFGALMAMGMAGLGFGIYDQNITSGIFGIICVLLAILVNYFRNEWNEDSRSNQVDEKLDIAINNIGNDVIKSVTPKIIRILKKDRD